MTQNRKKKDANIRSVCKVTKWNQEFTLTLGELNLALKNPAQFFNENSVILGVIHEVGFLLGVHLHNAVHVILMNHLCSFTSQRDHALKKANKQINGEWSLPNLGERQKSAKNQHARERYAENFFFCRSLKAACTPSIAHGRLLFPPFCPSPKLQTTRSPDQEVVSLSGNSHIAPVGKRNMRVSFIFSQFSKAAFPS